MNELVSYEAPAQKVPTGSFLLTQQALDTCPAKKGPLNQTQNSTLVNKQGGATGNQYNTYQADILKFKSLNTGTFDNHGKLARYTHGDDLPKKIIDPTNIEDMHCHIVTQIQKLRRIAMDLE